MKYTDLQLKEAVQLCLNYSQVCRRLGIFHTGNSFERVKNRIKVLELDTSHFLGLRTHCGNGSKFSFKRKLPELVLVKNVPNRVNNNTLKRAMLFNGIDYKCSCCGLIEWNIKKITLDIDHIDGDWSNCSLDNLRFLCPNCHRQTDTYGGKNKKSKNQ